MHSWDNFEKFIIPIVVLCLNHPQELACPGHGWAQWAVCEVPVIKSKEHVSIMWNFMNFQEYLLIYLRKWLFMQLKATF